MGVYGTIIRSTDYLNPQIIMHNKITNPNSPQNPPKRTYSFSQQKQDQSPQQPQQQQQKWSDCVEGFLEEFARIEAMHQVCVQIGALIRVNCGDVGVVQQVLRDDGTITSRVRDRMLKYLRVVHIANSQIDPYPSTNNDNNYDTQDYATNTLQKQDPPKQPHTQTTPSLNPNPPNPKNTTPTTHHQPQPQPHQIQLTISRKIPNHHPDPTNPKPKDRTPTQRRDRSTSQSQASQGKYFHKIQLKSVKRLDKRDDKRERSRSKSGVKIRDQGESRVEDKKVEGKKGEGKKQELGNRRYTISQREAKNNKTLSYQLTNMKSNSKLKVSRIRQQSPTKQPKQQKPLPLHKITPPCISPNRHKNECHTTPAPQNPLPKHLIKQPQYPLDIGASTNLVYETVQKSTDFLQMLKMMGDE